MRWAQEAAHGFYFSSVGCRVLKMLGNNDRKVRRCDVCAEAKKVGQKNIQRHHNPCATLAHQNTGIEYIANDPVKSKLEVEHQRATVKIIRQELAKLVLKKEMKDIGVLVPQEEGRRISGAINIISENIESELEKRGKSEACEL